MVDVIEKIKFYYKMIFMNRRSTVVMFLGLGISLALISEGLLFMYSFQYGAFTGFYNGVPNRQFTASISSYDIRDRAQSSIPSLMDATNLAIENSEVGERIKRVDWFLARGLFLVVNTSSGENIILPEINLYAIPTDYFSALSEIMLNGTTPQHVNDFIVVATSSTIQNTNLSETGTFPGYTPRFGYSFEEVVDLGIPNGGQYFNVSGIITKEDFSNNVGPLSDDFNAMTEYFSQQFLLTSYTNFDQYVSKLDYLTGYCQATGRIAFKLDEIDSFDINNEIYNLQRFSQELASEFTNEGYTSIIYTYLVQDLREFRDEFVVFQLFGLLFLTPIIGMALSLTNYSSNLLKRRQKRQISSMLQRGSSQKEVTAVLVLQVVELTISAILISFIIGFGFTWLLTKSVGFLNFTGLSTVPVINMWILYLVVGLGFIISIIINAKNIWDMTQITTQEAYEEHQTSTPGWQKLYLDIVLIVVGVLVWIVVKTQLKEDSAYAFAYGFGTTAPVLIIIGSIMFTARLFPILIDLLSKRTWQGKRFGLFGLATKRSSRRRSDVTRSLILITLTFTLIFSSIITVQSYQNFDTENAYYQVGADILIRNIDTNSNQTALIVNGIEGVEATTKLTITAQIIPYGYLVYSYIVVGIDPTTFGKVAYFERQYLGGQNPESFFESIQDVNDVVMQKEQLERIDTYEGEQFSLRYEKYSQGTLNQTLDVTGIYNYFPRFFTKFPDLENPTFRFNIIGTYELVELLGYSEYSVSGDLLVKVKEGYSISAVASEIETALGRSVTNVEEVKSTTEGSLRNTMLYGSVNASFISSLVITVAAIALMILIQSIENEREVITLKILGMSPRQLFSLFLIESLNVVIFGTIIGIGLGIAAAYMFTDILTFQSIVPPTEMLFPPVELSLAAGVLLLTSIVSAALTAWIVFRKDTIKAIKQI